MNQLCGNETRDINIIIKGSKSPVYDAKKDNICGNWAIYYSGVYCSVVNAIYSAIVVVSDFITQVMRYSGNCWSDTI